VQLDRASGVTAGAYLAEMEALGYRAHRLEGGLPGVALGEAPDDVLVSVVFLPA
jgi:hypothetical protein